jgi:hypothetical protein
MLIRSDLLEDDIKKLILAEKQAEFRMGESANSER